MNADKENNPQSLINQQKKLLYEETYLIIKEARKERNKYIYHLLVRGIKKIKQVWSTIFIRRKGTGHILELKIGGHLILSL